MQARHPGPLCSGGPSANPLCAYLPDMSRRFGGVFVVGKYNLRFFRVACNIKIRDYDVVTNNFLTQKKARRARAKKDPPKRVCSCEVLNGYGFLRPERITTQVQIKRMPV